MPMVYFKENYNFPRFQRYSNIFYREGVQLFMGGGGGSNSLFPIESHITCVFPGGGLTRIQIVFEFFNRSTVVQW